jgi:cytochrome d ubiquinol oxidase subunit I
MALDGLLISRAQFAFTIGYHILWPAYTIGISGFIVLFNVLWLASGQPVYRALLRFWIHLFALGFAMGVVTGVVLSYEIGMNWSVFAEHTSNVIGPFFTYEALMAFFMEAGFIGIMLFGIDRVGPRLHFFSCLVVALGAVISAFWILAANSWMQTPAGFTLADGKFELASWWAAIFNPSFPYRFFHMVVAGACALASPLPFIAILSGWTVTEVGRQPYVVSGYLRTAEAVSPVSAPAVLGSLTLFVVVYTTLLLAFLLYAWRVIVHGPQLHEPAQSPFAVRPGTDVAAARIATE